MQTISGLLSMAGFALLILGIAAMVLNRTGALGRPNQPRTLPSTLLVVVAVVAFVFGGALGAFIQIPARGEAESNKLVAASLTAAILQNRYIEKLSDQIKVMLVPSDGGGLILNLGDLLPATPSPAP